MCSISLIRNSHGDQKNAFMLENYVRRGAESQYEKIQKFPHLKHDICSFSEFTEAPRNWRRI